MHWFSLLKILLRGRIRPLCKATASEAIHSGLVSAPSGITIWIVWLLMTSTETQQLNQQLTNALLALIAVFICQLIFAPKLLGATSKFSYDLSCALRILLGEHLRKLSLGSFQQSNRQLIADQLIQAINRFEYVLSHSLANISAAVFIPMILGTLLLWLQWQLAISLLLALIISLLLQWLAGRLLDKRQQLINKSEQNLRDRILEYLQGIDILKSYGFDNNWRQHLEQSIEEAHKNRLGTNLFSRPVQLLPTLILEIGLLFTIASGNFLLLTGSIDTTAMLAMLLVGYRIYEPVKIFLADYILLRQSDQQLSQLDSLLHTPEMTKMQPQAKPKELDIRFNRVSFSYDKQPIIQDISFYLKEGGCYALVGSSGSGKSTILNLLLRLWDTDKGSISIGGVDIRAINQETYQTLFASAFQETFLFDDTIEKNVLFGDPQASKEHIKKVLKDSGCEEMAEQLKNGINSKIGENGRLLSGGQKQMIAIARAMLKNAPILLFDEASASLDPENQHLIQQAIEKMSSVKTIIIIAHDLRSISHADNILVIDKGKLIEQGSHQQLMTANGRYQQIWQAQENARGWQITAPTNDQP